MNTGWICPRCQQVWAPSVLKCECAPDAQAPARNTWVIRPYPEPSRTDGGTAWPYPQTPSGHITITPDWRPSIYYNIETR